MALPQTREEFKQFCLRKLGFPLNTINLDVAQIEDQIDYAISYYQKMHVAGSTSEYLSIQITPEMRAAKAIILPPSIFGVTRVFNIGSTTSNTMLSAQFSLTSDLMWQAARNGGGLADVQATMSYRSLLNELVSGAPTIRFNANQGKLFIDIDWAKIPNGTFIVLDCWKAVNPDEYPHVWSDFWLINYASALLKKQYGENLKKYSGVQLPGGITLDGQTLFSEGQAEVADLEDKIRSDWQEPPSFMIG